MTLTHSRVQQTIAGDLQILELLGSDGVSVREAAQGQVQEGAHSVYLGLQTHLGRLVAVRFFRTPHWQFPELPRELRRALRLATGLNHPHIAQTHDYRHLTDGHSYLITEYVDGPALPAELRAGLSAGDALEMGAQLAEALAACHAAPVVHTDVRPHRVLLTRDAFGRLSTKLTGLGLRWLMDTRAPRGLAADEAAQGRDVAAVGAVLYHSLSGRPWPVDQNASEWLAQLPRPLPPIPPREDLPRSQAVVLTALLERAMRPSDGAPLAAGSLSVLLREAAQRLARSHGEGNAEQGPRNSAPPSELGIWSPALLPDAPPRDQLLPTDIGRRLEATVLADLRAGEGRLLLVRGSVGGGRSWALVQLLHRVHAIGGYQLGFGRLTREGPGLGAAVARLIGVEPSPSGGPRPIARLRAALDRLGLSDAYERASLEALVQEQPGGQRVRRSARLTRLVERVCRRVARTRPALLVLDDLQSAREGEFAILAQLLTRMARAPLPLVVVAGVSEEALRARPKAHAALARLLRQGMGRIDELRLSPLTPDQTASLSVRWGAVDPTVAEELQRESGGNPLLLSLLAGRLEVPASLSPGLEGGLLRPGFDLTDLLQSADVAGVAVLLDRGLRALGERASTGRRLLAALSLLPPVFDARLLERYLEAVKQLPGGAETLPLLEPLFDVELLSESDDGSIRIEHPLMRAALRVELRSQSITPRLHAAAARALAPAARDSLQALKARAHHLGRAGALAEEAPLQLQIAAWAESESLPITARTAALRAVELLQQAQTGMEQLAPAAWLAARLSLTLADADEARAQSMTTLRSADPELRGRARLLLARLAHDQNDGETRERQLQLASREAQQLPADHPLQLELTLAQARYWVDDDPDQAESLVSALGGRVRSVEHMALCEIIHARAELARGHYPKARKHLQWTRELAHHHGSADPALESGIELVRLLVRLGESAEALELAQSLLEDARTRQHRHWETEALAILAFVLRNRGEWEEAENHERALLARYTWLKRPAEVARTLISLGECRRRARDLVEASNHYRRALKVYQDLGLPTGRATALANLGALEKACGRPSAAEPLLRESYALLQLHLPWIAPMVGVSLTGCLLQMGRDGEARDLCDAALKARNELAHEEDLGHELEQTGLLLRARGMPRRAQDMLRWAAEVYEGLGLEEGLLRVRSAGA